MIFNEFSSIFEPFICWSASVKFPFSTFIVFPLDNVISLLLIVLFSIVCVSFNVTTVLSIEWVTVSLVILVFIPVPPVNCNVSEPRETVSLPESEDILRSVEIFDVVAFVILPFESTVITGIAADEP